MKFKIFLAFLLITTVATVTAISLFPHKEKSEFTKTDYKSLNLDGIDKLMVIAHPDDDILWGGSELIHEDYLVVCITCGSDERRKKEFETVMERTNDVYVMLGYPDKTKGERDNWDSVRDDIISDLENIYNLKKWNKILTHNKDGEYGHIHHKMTNTIVTDIVSKEDLYYFGKYHSKKELQEKEIDLPLLDEETLKEKEELLNLYQTQDKTIHETFSHMIKSENVISYEDWNEIYEKD